MCVCVCLERSTYDQEVIEGLFLCFHFVLKYQPPKPKVKNSPGATASPSGLSNVGAGSRIPAAGGSRIPAPGSAGRTGELQLQHLPSIIGMGVY